MRACLAQEYEERTERIRKLKDEYTSHSTGLQALTAAVEQKKVSLHSPL